MDDMTFSYSNIPQKSPGLLIRIASVLIPGIRTVQKQIVPYAMAWRASNEQALLGQAPLWVVLGDSMGQGIGASSYKNGWVGQLDQLLRSQGKHYRIVNLSVSGAKVQDVIDRQLPAMRALNVRPALVTVTVG